MILNENYHNRTGINHYDILLKNRDYANKYFNEDYQIINMSPKEYIQRCADMFGVDYKYLTETRLDDNLKQCYKELSKGTKFDMPMINYKKNSQEGLHRAICSLLLEEETIPIMIINRLDNVINENIEKIDGNTEKEYKSFIYNKIKRRCI